MLINQKNWNKSKKCINQKNCNNPKISKKQSQKFEKNQKIRKKIKKFEKKSKMWGRLAEWKIYTIKDRVQKNVNKSKKCINQKNWNNPKISKKLSQKFEKKSKNSKKKSQKL